MWFLSRNRTNHKFRDRSDEILFIDARNLGTAINRRNIEFSAEDIQQVASTYHNWRNTDGKYEDIPGFCCAASIDEVREKDYILTPGRYVGLPEEEDDFDFEERFTSLRNQLMKQIAEEDRINAKIKESLSLLQIQKEEERTSANR